MAEQEWLVKNPATGETRTVTQREWNAAQLGKLGFTKPADLVETPGPVPTIPPTVIKRK
jgi:hypothetical protein